MTEQAILDQYFREKEASRAAHAEWVAKPSDETFFAAAKALGRWELALEQFQTIMPSGVDLEAELAVAS